VLLAVLCAIAGMALAPAAVAQPELILGVETNPKEIAPGRFGLVTVTVANRGDTAAPGVSIEADLPPGNVASFNQNFSTRSGVCTGSGTGNTTCDAGETVIWSIGTLPAGGARSVTFPLRPSGSAIDATTLTYTARARVGANVAATASATAVVLTAAPFSLAIEADVDPVEPGARVAFTLLFANRTGATAQSLVLSLPVPAGLSFVEASDGGILATNTVTWSLSPLSPGQVDSRRVLFTVDPGVAPGDLVTTPLNAAITGNAPTPVAASASVPLRVAGESPLSLVVEMGPDPARPNETVVASIHVGNESAAPLADVVVEAVLPDAMTSFNQNLVTDGGLCSVSGTTNATCDRGERVEWQLGTLAPGASRTLVLPASVQNGTASGTMWTLAAAVRAGASGERRDRRTIASRAPRTLQLAIDEGRQPAIPGDPFVYELRYANVGAATAQNPILRLVLPPEVALLNASGTPVATGNTLVWNLAPIAAGASGSQRVRVELDADAPAGSVIRIGEARLIEGFYL
jgi:uncharacterized repeat protein (TIGR01451 family)